MKPRKYHMKTIEDQMNSALVTLTGLLKIRKLIDESIENLVGNDLSLHSNGEPDEIIAASKICVHRAKELILEVSKMIDECLNGNI